MLLSIRALYGETQVLPHNHLHLPPFVHQAHLQQSKITKRLKGMLQQANKVLAMLWGNFLIRNSLPPPSYQKKIKLAECLCYRVVFN